MPDPLGRACIFPGDKRKAVTVVDVAIVRPSSKNTDARWLMHFINAPRFRAAVNSLQSGSTRKRISRKNLGSITLPVPQYDQQKRIADEIEKQFSRLDEAVSGLKRIKANLKRYKASVLKASVEGKLTEDWRKKHPNVEPASALLKRMLIERKKKWEEKNPGKKYKEPVAPDTSNLPELPNGWVWATTDQLFSFVTSGSRGWARYYSESGPLFLRMGNLDHDTINIDLSETQRVQPPAETEGIRTRVMSGDILLSITADVGMIGLVPDRFEEAYINQHIALARPNNSINSAYLAWYLSCKIGQDQLKKLQRGATKVGLGLDDIRAVNIALPPLIEQQGIIEGIDHCFSVMEKIERTTEISLKHAERLRQGILKKAFSGNLKINDGEVIQNLNIN
jgi:type I restriction enzyme, S subunit